MLSPKGASGVLSMVDVVDGLKVKLAEINAEIDELRREIVALNSQKVAFETVIRVYDPGTPRLVPRNGEPSRNRTPQGQEQPGVR